ncbi:hypothetical protein D3C78_1510060 [compost metagenome]
MEAACSTTSRPRKISPSASAMVLPCSALRVWAMRLLCSRINACSLSMMRMRAPIGVSRQVLKARSAAATAASTSSAVANGTRASTCWVAGLTMSRHSVVFDSTHWPSISSLTCSTLVWSGDWGAFICVLLGIIVRTRSPAPCKREVASWGFFRV